MNTSKKNHILQRFRKTYNTNFETVVNFTTIEKVFYILHRLDSRCSIYEILHQFFKNHCNKSIQLSRQKQFCPKKRY